MTVKITKPALNIREELSNLKKPSGTAGEAMLRAETPQEQGALIGAGLKNWIINPNGQVDQRGIGNTILTAEDQYAIDRWRGRPDMRIEKIANDGFTIQSTGANGNKFVMQVVEDAYEEFRDKLITFSFEYKVTAVGGDLGAMAVSLNWADAAGDHISGENFGGMANNALVKYSPYWQKISTTKAWRVSASGNAKHLRVGIPANYSAVTSTVQIRNVELVIGSVSGGSVQRSYAEELALCQRYCYKIGGEALGSNNESHLGTGSVYNAAGHIIPIHFPVEMRWNPSVTGYPSSGNVLQVYVGASGQYASASDIDSINDFSGATARLYATGFSGLTAGQASWVHTVANAYLIFDAEL